MVDRGNAKVTDRRRSGWFRVDNAVLDRFGAELGPYGIAVYAALSRRCGSKDDARVGIANLAKLTGMSRTSVKKALGALERTGLVEIERRDQYGQVSEYFLNDVGDVSAKNTPGGEVVATRPPSQGGGRHATGGGRHTTGGQSPRDHKEETIQEETGKEELSLRDFSRLTALMTKLRLSTAMPSLVLSAEELAALRSSGYRRELEKIEGERKPVRPDRVK